MSLMTAPPLVVLADGLIPVSLQTGSVALHRDSADMTGEFAGRHCARISVRLVGLMSGIGSHLAGIRPSPVDDGVHQVLDMLHGGKIAQYLIWPGSPPASTPACRRICPSRT